MKVLEILIEYSVSKLDRLFSYAYNGEKDIKPLCRVMVEFNKRKICGVVINVKEINKTLNEYKLETGLEIKEVLSIIDETPLFNEELSLLATEIANYYFSPRISVFFSMLPPSLKPAISSERQPKIAYEYYVKPTIDVNYDNLTTKQAELLYKIINNGEMKKGDCPIHLLKALINKGKVTIIYREKNRFILEDIEKIENLTLNEEQQECFNQIVYGNENIYLLEGVTGSGKTEVYLHVAQEIINQKKTVLMLVPEITLSYMMVRRFQERFDKIAVLHSKLTAAQRYDEYRKIKNGEVDIVIGARSAIFAPLDNIGLIIIDEEHSETYKQEDQMPYYNAIEVAKMRQRYHNCKMILGSATPSLETKSRALKGVYKQLFLTKRINDIPLPSVKIIDMTDRNNICNESALLSKPLIEALKDRLQKKEQSILLVNRRGFAPYVSCKKCGYVIKCPSCQVALTYHYETKNLSCHHCGHEQHMFNICPKCKSDRIFKAGFGTEKIELELKNILPEARILRLDSDVSKKYNAVKNILEAFSNHEADILVGTQIVAKGHDFKDVTFSAVVLADIGLAIPSFRANERTFSLITQTIGRSGRKHNGEAYIQTYLKDHFVIKNAAKQDYLSFFNTEMYYRKLLQNPPYTYMALLLVSGENEEDVIDGIHEVKKYLSMYLGDKENTSIVGPSEMFIKKYLNQYRRKIVIKYKNFDVVKPLLQDLVLFFNQKNNLKLTININPYEDY